MKNKKWILPQLDLSNCSDLAKNLSIPTLLSKVLHARGFTNAHEVQQYLKLDENSLFDPFLLRDMQKAVDTITNAIKEKKKFIIFGDYDVDGVTSTTILTDYLKSQGADCNFYIPDRISEGYGLNSEAILSIKNQGYDIIITVDSGITAVEEVSYAKSLGLDVIITDHHECKDQVPEGDAIVNPKQPNCDYPFKELSGVAVAFKLICALAGEDNLSEVINKYIALVAIGTIADVMPLRGENRTIVMLGLKALENPINLGIRTLMQEAGILDKKITASSVSFTLAPRINAAGRVGSATDAVEMLLTDDIKTASLIASDLCRQNKERQLTENEILEQAIKILEKEYIADRDKIIVLWGENWHHGVIGIVSSRLSDKYACPVVLISLEGDKGKGSGRSIKGFNLFSALEYSNEYIEKFGGHELAAGLTVSRENLPKLRESLLKYANEFVNQDDLIPTMNVDCAIDIDDVTIPNINALTMLEPYGMGNPQPVFCIRDLKVKEITPISANRHVKLLLQKDNITMTAMMFGTGSESLEFTQGNIIDVCASLDLNDFRSKISPQLLVKDIHLSEYEKEKDELSLKSYDSYINCMEISDDEVNHLYPDRSDLVAVWRHIISRAKNKRLILKNHALSRKVSWESKRDINIGKLFVCLDVFSESRLLSYNFRNGLLNIMLKEYEGKADISQSVVLLTLKNMKKAN